MAIVKVTIHDARSTRDHSKDDKDGWGQILGVAHVEGGVDVADVISLPDGERVIVLGYEEVISLHEISQKVRIGALPPRDLPVTPTS